MARGVDSIERPWTRQSRKAREENLPPMSSEQQGPSSSLGHSLFPIGFCPLCGQLTRPKPATSGPTHAGENQRHVVQREKPHLRRRSGQTCSPT